MTGLYAIPNNVCALNASGRIARQQLLENIMFLSLLQMGLQLSFRNVKEAIMAAIRKLKAMPFNPTRYRRADRTVNLLLLTSQLDHGAIDLVQEVFMQQMQIQILGVGPRASADVTVEEVVSTLRPGVCPGEAQNLVMSMPCRGLAIIEVVGGAGCPRFVPPKKRSLLIKVDRGNPTTLAATPIDAGDSTGNRSTVEHKSAQSKRLREYTATTDIHAGISPPHCEPNSLPPPRIHRSLNSPMWNTCTESAARRWRACTPTRHALGEIKAIRLSARRSEAKVNLHDISRVLAYRATLEKRFSKSTAASASDEGIAPLARVDFEESDVDGEGEVQDFVDEEQVFERYEAGNETTSVKRLLQEHLLPRANCQELLFHAIPGPVGLVDTAVKSAETGLHAASSHEIAGGLIRLLRTHYPNDVIRRRLVLV
ncbi:hypothetical protein B9Z19DRAFT_1118934 [Tuber borchii]|uniref:Uncharacterized protein n=1 Tax=Tuber borchii TaxID=42251 RepID=A0A2T7A769_TUBBO|nr:hypothetical protein B9Z19DRAFT_1118934 [Tuber borchii]